jgi:hypothetical protein
MAAAIPFSLAARSRLPKLALNHAQVGGLHPDDELVARAPAHRKSSRHHLTSRLEVTRHLERNAQDVESTRSAWLAVIQSFSQGDRPAKQPHGF